MNVNRDCLCQICLKFVILYINFFIKSDQILYLDTKHPGAPKFSLKRVCVCQLENSKIKKLKNHASNLFITTVKIL